MGARVAPPIIPCSGKFGDGTVFTKALNEYNAPVRAHFTVPYVVYVGSDRGCGCGFRHISYQEGWLDEDIASEPDYKPEDTQANHEALAALLRQHFGAEAFVELYGCWEGDFALPEKDRRNVTLAEMTHVGFHFRELGYCRVSLDGSTWHFDLVLDGPQRHVIPWKREHGRLSFSAQSWHVVPALWLLVGLPRFNGHLRTLADI